MEEAKLTLIRLYQQMTFRCSQHMIVVSFRVVCITI